MEKEWSELSPEKKRAERFNQWLSPKGVIFKSPDAEALYKQNVTRLIDAITLKEPDRVPVFANAGHIPARYSGYTIKEVMYDSNKVVKAWEKYLSDFEYDVLPSAGAVRCGKALDLLDSKMYKWSGHGLNDDYSTQYVEAEYLREDEWDMLKQDPSDFYLRAYLPRVYGAAEPLKKLPPLSTTGRISGGLAAFADPQVQAAFESLGKAGKEEAAWQKMISEIDRDGLETGLPYFYRGFVNSAPLDSIGAGLRGTKGTVMDMFKQPEKLIEYMENAVPDAIKRSATWADRTGIPVMFIPLHRGADGFMSEKQFNTFYWPYLRQVLIGQIKEGLVPLLFAEGGYNTRLEIIKDLPRGKVIWHFDQTDMARAKEVLGDNACIMGNVPTSLLVTGTQDDVKA